MLKNTCLLISIVFSLLFPCGIHNIFANEDHQDSIASIEQTTFANLQSILSAYQGVYGHLVKKETDGIADLAQKMMDTAAQGMQTEPDGAGRRMMQHVFQGAEELKNADCLHETQCAFTSISNALFIFFKSWPNQLKRNELKLYWCKKDGHYWLQPQNLSPVCPYAATGACSDIEEVKNTH